MSETVRTVETVFEFVVANSLPAAVTVLAVLALQFIFRRRFSPRWRHALWYIVLLRLALPWTPEAPFSAYNAAPETSTFTRMVVPEQMSVATPIDAVSPQIPDAKSRTPEHAPSSASLPALVWLVGVAGVIALVTVNSLRIARRVRRAQLVTDAAANDIMRVCVRHIGLRRPLPIVAHDTDNMTAVVGLFRPRLLIPRGTLDAFSKQELEHVIMHELAHVKRRDIAVAWAATLLQALYWFHPLVWFALYRMRIDRETACDALALSRMPRRSVSDYGETLLKTCRPLKLPELLPNVAGIHESQSRMKRRIAMILQFNARSYRYTLLGGVVMALAGASLLTNATAQQDTLDPGNKFPHRIEIETYQHSWSAFQEGDNITVEEVRGDRPRLEAGGAYYVRGSYTLNSVDEAALHVYATNGEVDSGQGPNVTRGNGTFERVFTMTKTGMPHVSYYPVKGGNGFGDTYFRQRAVEADAPDATMDVAITDASLKLSLKENLRQVQMVVEITNRGNVVAPGLDVIFYLDEPGGEGNTFAHRAGPIHPGESWHEITNPIDIVGAGTVVFSAVIDPENDVPETDESNNSASLELNTGNVTVSLVTSDE